MPEISNVVKEAFGLEFYNVTPDQFVEFCNTKKKQANTYFGNQNNIKSIKMPRDKSQEHEKLDGSVIKMDNKLYLLAPKGEYLGKGAFGQVKLAVCLSDDPIDFNKLYAIKRETINSAQQQTEIYFAKQVGLMVGNKQERTNSEKGQIKYYSVLEYAGETINSISKNLAKPLSKDQKVEVAIKMCLEVAKLHQLNIVHRDLKPDNVAVNRDKEPLAVRLIDFGCAQFDEKVSSSTIICGTNGYLPFTINESSNIPHLREQMNTIGLKGLDIFALKKIIENEQLLRGEERILKEILNTTSFSNNECNPPTAEILAAHLICHSVDMELDGYLDEECSKKIIATYQSKEWATLDLDGRYNMIFNMLTEDENSAELDKRSDMLTEDEDSAEKLENTPTQTMRKKVQDIRETSVNSELDTESQKANNPSNTPS